MSREIELIFFRETIRVINVKTHDFDYLSDAIGMAMARPV